VARIAAPHVDRSARAHAAPWPRTVDDLAHLPSGDATALRVHGAVTVTGEVTLHTAVNALATPGRPIAWHLANTRAAAVIVGATWTVQGDLELRLARPAGHLVRLEVRRQHGRSLAVSARASSGLATGDRSTGALRLLLRAVSPDPEADLLALVDAGLDDATTRALQEAVSASVDRSLSLAAQLDLASLHADQAVVAFDIDLARLDGQESDAVTSALRGDVSAVSARARAGGAIAFTGGEVLRLQARRAAWRINLLGLLNVSGVAELVREGRAMYDPATGALTVADRVTARRIRTHLRPLESHPAKLRRVVLESLMVTTACRAGGVLGPGAVTLSARHAYVAQHGRTRRAHLEDHYRTLIALGLCMPDEREARLGAVQGDGAGDSTFVVTNELGDAACGALFLDSLGRPHDEEHYERIGRLALIAVLPATADTAYRRRVLATEAAWVRTRVLGDAIGAALPALTPAQQAVVRGDIVTLLWWASAMHRAAVALAAARTTAEGGESAPPDAHARTLEARARLTRALGRVVATTRARFDEPWDIVAMDLASQQRGVVEAAILTPQWSVRYVEGLPATAARITPARDVRLRDAATRAARTAEGEQTGKRRLPLRGPDRDWTAAERAVFTRHVVNLGGGRLSDDGTVQSSRAQVEAIFTQGIPEYAARRRAEGQRPRVVLFAHGGLVSEREGLASVLARQRAWETHGVYPVCFVWETGIRETLRAIAADGLPRGLVLAREVHEARLGQAARRTRRVWTQMKAHAETAASADGGARVVVECARRLAASGYGDVEFHAVGHSAGAVLLAHVLPHLVAHDATGTPGPRVRTCHLLAPALTMATFAGTLMPLVGAGRPIGALTVYAMRDALERADASMRPWPASLLYLVRSVLEEDREARLLGLEADLVRDVTMVRFFGLAGGAQVADLVRSPTDADAPLHARSQAITHGGFDNDVQTMSSVIGRIIAAPDTQVIEYVEDALPITD
jgi:hypothetical protein